MMECVRNTSGDLLKDWERAETPHGVPYYINHCDESTQWDHPIIEKLVENLEMYNMIKYTAYRTALKLRKIQKLLNLDTILLPDLVKWFAHSHIFSNPEQKTITCAEFEKFLTEIFVQVSVFDHKLYAELLANVVLNMCDLCRKGGKVPVIYAKVYLTVLCFGRLPDKFKYLFSLFVESDKKINELGLTKLFHLLAEIPEFLFEGKSFGNKLVCSAVKSCMEKADCGYVTEGAFLEWLLRQPQNLVWLSTLTRVTAAERVEHKIRCEMCKRYPVTGMRYRCFKCFNYNQCQQCFLMGFSNKKHKVKHPVQEYCRVATPKEETKAFLSTLGNKLKWKFLSQHKRQYLPIAAANNSIETRDVLEKAFGLFNTVETFSPDTTSKMLQTDDYLWEGVRLLVPKNASVDGRDNIQMSDGELESIIIHLEDENQHLIKEVEQLNEMSTSYYSCSTSSTNSSENQKTFGRIDDIVQEHNQQIQVQVKRLRNLLQKHTEIPNRKDNSPSAKREDIKDFRRLYQSTPTANETHASFKNVSPIEAIQDSLHFLGQVTQNTVPAHISTANSPFNTNSSLRRKVLRPKNCNDANRTVHLSHKMKSSTSSSQSTYGFSDLTETVGSDTLQKLKETHFSLPHANQSIGYTKGKSELQDIIDELENLQPL